MAVKYMLAGGGEGGLDYEVGEDEVEEFWRESGK